MGYYVNTEGIDITVPKDLLEPAYKAILALNEDDSLKQGGSHGPNGKREFWFSWMPQDLSTLADLKEVLTTLGFESSDYNEQGDLELGYYSNKTGQEDLFLEAIAPFVKEGSSAVWKGEDDTYWKWEFSDGKMLVIPGEVEITWFPDKAYTAKSAWLEQQKWMEEIRAAWATEKSETTTVEEEQENSNA